MVISRNSIIMRLFTVISGVLFTASISFAQVPNNFDGFSTGSGDVEVGTAHARTVVKTGSGDLKVVTANHDVSLSTGSGDLTVGSARRGRVSAKGASSDVRIGIPAGTPVWADLTTVTGKVRSDIESVGAPQEGQDHIELEARTVSGDIVLTQV